MPDPRKTPSKRATPKKETPESPSSATIDLDAMTLAEQEKMYTKAEELGWPMETLAIHRLTWLATWAVLSTDNPDLPFEEVGQTPANETIQAGLLGKD